MTAAIYPAWADELRHRYLRGEAWLFVVHGNVHDLILHQGKLVGAVDFLASEVLDKKQSVLRYNVSTGCRFIKKTPTMDALAIEDLIAQRNPERVMPVLEQLLYYQRNVGLVVDHAEMIAPAGDPTFFSQADRMSVVTLQRWSLAPEIERADNIVLLVTESAGELNPKIVANPRVAAVAIPMPDIDQRRAVIRQVNPDLDEAWLERFADITAGLRNIQIKSILQPPAEGEDDPESRLRFIEQLVGSGKRARKLAAVTRGMSRAEIQELVGVEAPAADGDDDDHEFTEVLSLIARRKREIIERECFGIIEFINPGHDFSVIGGMDEIKRELSAIARDIREGRRSRVPMGLLFTGPMGTGKTFVAEAFVKESGLTGLKLKNFRSKWVGSTESNLERILDVIRAIGQVIVVIDEGERSFGSAEDGDSGTSSRVIARLKEFMSDTSNRGRVLFIMMTNRPDKLDIDIKRAGRLDRKIPFLYPQSAEQVERVLEAQVRKHDLDTDIEFPRDRARISERLIGYSNADLEALALLAYGYASVDADTGGGDAGAGASSDGASSDAAGSDGARSDGTGSDGSGSDGSGRIDVATFERAVADYLPSRDRDMLEYMELLAVFEASNRRMLPPKYAQLSIEELQARLDELRIRCAGRR